MNTKTLISIIAFICFIGNVKSEVKADSSKIYFENALQEVTEMLEENKPLDFQRAVFVTENAYHENNYSYKSFERAIKNHTYHINQLIRANNKSDSLDFNVKVNKNGRFNIDEIRYTPEQKKELYNNVIINWSIFTYLTDTTTFGSMVHYPYQYNSKDPFGMHDWRNSQVINLLASNNSIGNCFALTALYKIFANQFNSDAVICTAPQHIYIQHKDHKGDWYNVELATAGHPADGSIQTLTYTTNKALMNDIALRALDEKQSIALCLVNLAKSYEHKYQNRTDEFLMQCAELVLKHDPKNLNALLLKQQVLDARVVEYARVNDLDNIEKLRKDNNINVQFQQLENHLTHLSELGYIQMPVDMQEVVLSGFKGENAAQFIKKDKNPSPFTSIDVPEEENQYLDLSHGIFQEVFEPKEIEVYGHFTFNTKSNELTKIDTQTVNNQIIDPVAFAYDLGARMYDARLGRFLSIDPAWKAYPFQSPYAYALNNPIRVVDEEGEGPGDGVQKLYVTKTVIEVNGEQRTVYLKKRFYDNASPKQVARYKKAALTSNGWYLSSKAEYEQFQKNPNQGAFNTTIDGVNTPEKQRIANFQLGALSGNRIDIAGDREGIFRVKNTDNEGNASTFTFNVFDKKGNLVSSENQTVEAGESGDFNFNLNKGDYVQVDYTGGSGAEAGVYDKAKKGGTSLSNINQYGTDTPTQQDKQEVGKILEEKQ